MGAVKRGANRYSPNEKLKFQQILDREQNARRVPPPQAMVPRDLGHSMTPPPERVGPNVVSKFFYKKVVAQRDKDFWKKPWGRKKVDLPMPSYLRDFKDADSYLLVPHFAHYRRNVGIAKDAQASDAMMRSLSAPLTVPGDEPEPRIYGSHAVRNPARLPMVALPPRTPLENTIQMNERASASFSHSQGGMEGPMGGSSTRKKRDPKKLNKFVEELTEAYALCSAHEQLKAEINNVRHKAEHKAGVTLPALPSGAGAVHMLKTILAKSHIKH